MHTKKLIQSFALSFTLVLGFLIGFIQQTEAYVSLDDQLVGCESESMHSPGSDYYDCGDCKKIKDRAGIGNSRSCKTSANQKY